ncbi:MAG: hypothetical protein KBH15_04090 [Candidatus Atribacteria bacterium]|nr:hypothetical protein [Candidatus Atribacteria bacterium]
MPATVAADEKLWRNLRRSLSSCVVISRFRKTGPPQLWSYFISVIILDFFSSCFSFSHAVGYSMVVNYHEFCG